MKRLEQEKERRNEATGCWNLNKINGGTLIWSLLFYFY